MTSQKPSSPVVRRLIAAINDGDREAFLALLTLDATLTDDGEPRSLHDWIDREIFSVHGHMTVEHGKKTGSISSSGPATTPGGRCAPSGAFRQPETRSAVSTPARPEPEGQHNGSSEGKSFRAVPQ